jgi:cytochrome c-type biogenesis protein CcmH
MAKGARLPLWARVTLPAVVLVVALIVGSGALDGATPTSSQRVASIEAVVRCPSCPDISVAQSNESTAIAVRHEIERQVAAGRSTAQIQQTLVSQYGQTILLIPPDPGGVPVIWLVPAVAGGVALAAVAVLFWRRSKQFAALRDDSVA